MYYYPECVASTVTFRIDNELDDALTYLQQQHGVSRSQAIRDAIMQAEQHERQSRLREESAAVRDDPDDAAISRKILTEMNDLSAW